MQLIKASSFLVILSLLLTSYSLAARLPLPPMPQKPALPAQVKPAKIPVKTPSAEPLSLTTRNIDSTAQGTMSPSSGPWHTKVIVRGNNFALSETVRAVWYVNNDSNQKQLGSSSVTVRQRIKPDQIEIEIPKYSGQEGGGIIRIMLTMPGKLAPIFAGEFTIGELISTTEPFQAISVSTAPFIMTGKRIPPFQAVSISTAPFIMTGKRIPPFTPITVNTAPFIMTGKRIQTNLPTGQ